MKFNEIVEQSVRCTKQKAIDDVSIDSYSISKSILIVIVIPDAANSTLSNQTKNINIV